MQALIDTDILFLYLKGNKLVENQMKRYLAENGRLNISVLSYDEIIENLNANKAMKQLNDFMEFSRYNNIIPLTVNSIEIAAGLYSSAKSLKNPFDDISILIAAICIENQFRLITRQPDFFSRITGLIVENWEEN
jgi:tRNA(fMet)-specific endonuclease VapC